MRIQFFQFWRDHDVVSCDKYAWMYKHWKIPLKCNKLLYVYTGHNTAIRIAYRDVHYLKHVYTAIHIVYRLTAWGQDSRCWQAVTVNGPYHRGCSLPVLSMKKGDRPEPRVEPTLLIASSASGRWRSQSSFLPLASRYARSELLMTPLARSTLALVSFTQSRWWGTSQCSWQRRGTARSWTYDTLEHSSNTLLFILP